MNASYPTLVVCEKISQALNLVKNCSDESDEIKFLTLISFYTVDKTQDTTSSPPLRFNITRARIQEVTSLQ